jgi:uncharacterized protein YecE (DUF72 family)
MRLVLNNARAWIGTSGWNYTHWRGIFYPQSLRSDDWLRYYARNFDTVELNSSFYRIPAPHLVRGWQERAPVRFRFAVKLWRGITHYRKLKNCSKYLSAFLASAEELESRRRGPLLIQLPPNQGKDLDRLKRFLDDLKDESKSLWKIAVEFRNPQWLCDEVYELLDRRRAAVCIHDMPGSVTTEPNDASFVYVRRHGSGRGRYVGRYTAAEIEADACRVGKWLRDGRSVYVYFNNDVKGYAIENAQQLKAELK